MMGTGSDQVQDYIALAVRMEAKLLMLEIREGLKVDQKEKAMPPNANAMCSGHKIGEESGQCNDMGAGLHHIP